MIDLNRRSQLDTCNYERLLRINMNQECTQQIASPRQNDRYIVATTSPQALAGEKNMYMCYIYKAPNHTI